MTHTLTVHRYDPSDPRLGRHVRHDSRSLEYRAPETADVETLVSVRHQRHVPVLDQGQIGSCTGNAATGCVATAGFWDSTTQKVLSITDSVADEAYAVSVYSAATRLDTAPGTYPPTDTGSDGLSVAKVLTSRGLISGYTHALSLNATLTALSRQPVIIGTEWTQDMFTPDPDGRLHPTGAVAGGHEYVLDELDVDKKRVWMCNSWATTWGIDGRAWMTWDDLGTLLSRQGDCTVFTPLSQPAPQPAPTPTPTPSPAPTPTPSPSPTPPEQAVFVAEAEAWLARPPWFYKTFQSRLRTYLDSLGSGQ